MSYIFSFFLLSGILFFAMQGNIGQMLPVITEATGNCGSFVLKLLFLTAFFSGVIQMGEDAGLMQKISGFLQPLLKRIFETNNSKILKKISINISANLLGIGNAATPSGLAAMEVLDEENNQSSHPSDDMCRFVLFNTCSIQLIPTTIMGLRAMAGSKNPTVIVLPVIMVSFFSLITGLLICNLLLKLNKKRKPLC